MEDYETLRRELELYKPELLERPFLMLANKLDIPVAKENLAILQERYGENVLGISAATGQGLDAVIEKTYALLQSIPADQHQGEERVLHRYQDEKPFTIQVEEGIYVVSGKRIENLVRMTNFEQDGSLQRFQRTIERMGLEEALREKGIQEGNLVRILDLEFEYSE